ncbi:MAG: 3-ketoacyl-ACP reductase [Pseudomonadota bacterium]|nr:3-ketoacyl-ACP reductase [Pseudomonadota bacterium]
MSGYAVLVTGGGRGIGKGVACALAERGFAVAVNALEHDAGVDETLALLQARGVKAVATIGDISDLSRHEDILTQAESGVGELTTLVNNAGVSVLRRGDLLEVTPQSYDHCQSVNARGTFFLTQAWAKRALARPAPIGLHRSIITISSSNAVAVSIARGEYCVSKSAASMIAKLFAVRLGAHDIGSYEIRPGLIETPMTAVVKDVYEQRIAEGLTVIPRMGQPRDIGDMCVALATGQLAYCTGQALQADGGLVIPRF